MPETRRNRRGLVLLPLGIAALTAATIGLYWYFSRGDPLTRESSTRHNPPSKRKSVVIVLTNVFLENTLLMEGINSSDTELPSIEIVCGCILDMSAGDARIIGEMGSGDES